MQTTDPIADFLTRVRNAVKARHRRVDIPASNVKKAVAQILLDEKFIANFTVLEDGKQGVLRINLKYNNGRPVIAGIRRVSKPGIRQYKGKSEIPRVMGGLGVAIVSTSRGIMTDTRARNENVGGEILAFVW
jgi:small subunit ribosomal protein S8